MLQTLTDLEARMTRRARRRPASMGEALIWYHFIPISCAQGDRWYRDFQDTGAEQVAFWLDESVALMRLRRVDEGRCLLNKSRERQLAIAEAATLDITGVLEEGYWGCLAYCHYLERRFTEARDGMARAQAAIVETLEAAPYLITFAQKCHQLVLNEARVAREQRDWRDMWHLIEQARGMAWSTLPLCRLSYGGVFQYDIDSFFRQIDPSCELERRALGILLDRQIAIRDFENRALGASTPPQVVIDCP